MKKILLSVAAAALFIAGGSLVGSDEARASCDIKDNQYANGWTCESEVISSQQIQVWVRSGDGDNCRFGTADEVVTQDVAINPGNQVVDVKSGEETSSYQNVSNPGGSPTSCASLGDVLILSTGG